MKKLLTYFPLLLGTCLSTGCNTATSTDETIEPSSSSSTAILISSSSAAALSKTTCLDQATGISCALEHFPDTLYYEYNDYARSAGTAHSAHSTTSIYLVDKEQGLFGLIINSHSEEYHNIYEHPDTTIVDTVIHDTVPRDSIAHLLYSAEDAIKLDTVNFYELPDSLTAVYSSTDGYQGSSASASNAIYVDENGFLIYFDDYSHISIVDGSSRSYRSLNAWHAPLLTLLKP